MKLYVNGDSHTAGAEAVNRHAFAEDDPELYDLGRKPHPDNLLASWGYLLSQKLGYDFFCDAESASSNTRILRTTKQWLDTTDTSDILIIIQWSTWEREEWLHDGVYYQVNGSGVDRVPQQLRQDYRQYVANVDWNHKTNFWHSTIWDLHCQLDDQKIPHIFFNGNNDFSIIGNSNYDFDWGPRRNWGPSYIRPYDPDQTYNALIRAQGINPVTAKSWHFGKDGHSFFAQFMLQYCIDNKFI